MKKRIVACFIAIMVSMSICASSVTDQEADDPLNRDPNVSSENCVLTILPPGYVGLGFSSTGPAGNSFVPTPITQVVTISKTNNEGKYSDDIYVYFENHVAPDLSFIVRMYVTPLKNMDGGPLAGSRPYISYKMTLSNMHMQDVPVFFPKEDHVVVDDNTTDATRYPVSFSSTQLVDALFASTSKYPNTYRKMVITIPYEYIAVGTYQGTVTLECTIE